MFSFALSSWEIAIIIIYSHQHTIEGKTFHSSKMIGHERAQVIALRQIYFGNRSGNLTHIFGMGVCCPGEALGPNIYGCVPLRCCDLYLVWEHFSQFKYPVWEQRFGNFIPFWEHFCRKILGLGARMVKMIPCPAAHTRYRQYWSAPPGGCSHAQRAHFPHWHFQS